MTERESRPKGVRPSDEECDADRATQSLPRVGIRWARAAYIDTIKRGRAAQRRAIEVLAREAKRPDSVGLATRTAIALGEGDRIVNGAGLSAVARYEPHASAHRVTRELRGAKTAFAHALDGSVTGPLPKQRIRVRARGGARELPARPQARPDRIAIEVEHARRQAQRQLIESIAAFLDPQVTGAARKNARDAIRSILHTWADDSAVIETATRAGWRLTKP